MSRNSWPFSIFASALVLMLACGAQSLADDAQAVELAKHAKQIFVTNCYRCHGQGGRNDGGFNVVTDLARLVAKKKVLPGNPGRSKLFQKMSSGEMPPETDDSDQSPNPKPLSRPSKEEVAEIEAWIKAGAPDVPATTTATRAFITEAEILTLIRDDLKTIERRDRKYARYFTITHLSNTTEMNDDQLLTYRNGLTKLVNSLSWGRRVKRLRPIDPAQTIFRIDLRDFEWDESVWKAILAQYPYGITHSDVTAQFIYQETRCELPYVRADWFVFAASKPPLYHDVLQLPKTDRELETNLNVDVAGNIRRERVARAAFNSSGVSRNNRMIERHKSSFGAYWKSYDFAGNVGRQKLLVNPLGPGDGARAFQHDGGEIIFNLPNGFQAYMLTTAHGKRLDKGPTNIVLDKEQADSAVVNGISCMRCHKDGMLKKEDQVRDLAKEGGVFPEDVAADVLALYPTKEKFEELLNEDTQRFAQALRETGAPASKDDPIFQLARQFENELELPLAAAEAGLKPDDFRNRIRQSPKLVASIASLLVPGGTVKRDTFVATFPDIISELRLGTHLAVTTDNSQPSNPSVPQPKLDAKLITNTIGMKLTLIPAGSFAMGSPESNKEAFDDEEPQHSVRISKAFYLGIYEVTQEEYGKVVGSNPSYFTANGGGKEKVANIETRKLPVEQVSWLDAVAFCNALSEKEGLTRFYTIYGTKVSVSDWNGKGYRLPTEAEWEHACRAGKPTRYSFGDEATSLGEFGWFGDNSDGCRSYAVVGFCA